MKTGDRITLVTRQFLDGAGIDAITVRDGRCMVRMGERETVATVVGYAGHGHYRIELDDGQIWKCDAVGNVVES